MYTKRKGRFKPCQSLVGAESDVSDKKPTKFQSVVFGKQDQGVWCPGSSVSASVDPLSVRLALGRTSGCRASRRSVVHSVIKGSRKAPEGGH